MNGEIMNQTTRKTVVFGEVLLRLSPPGAERFVQTSSFDAVFGGAEANAAAALAGFGMPASVVTKLPANEIGSACLASLRRHNTDTSLIARGGDRIGIYYLEKGASLRPSKVIYDRRGSSFAQSLREDYDWEKIFSDASAFFFTGITPALGSGIREILSDALAVCRAKSIPVFCDVNYRPTLWSREDAAAAMELLLPGVSTLVINEEHAALLFGVNSDRQEEDTRLEEIAKRLASRYDLGRVALTLRLSESSDVNVVSGALYDAKTDRFVRSRSYRVGIVDRIGGGDAFSAGLIYGSLMGWDAEKTVGFAAAANALKHSIPGDALIASAEEVEALMLSDGTVRLRR